MAEPQDRPSQLNEPELHVGPEYAVAERDVSEIVTGEIVAGSSLWRDAGRRLLRNKLAVFGIVIVILIVLSSLIGPIIIKRTTGFTYDSIPKDSALLKSFPPFRGLDGRFTWSHPMGTDNAGRDVLVRVLSGGQVSLMVALIATLVSLVIGVSYGAIAGYLGGRVDDLMMRVVDVLYSIPFIFIVIFLVTILGEDSVKSWLEDHGIDRITIFFFVVGAIYWLTMARVVRGQVISLKHEQFVEAARTIGAGTGRIIFLHLVPNVLGIVIV